MARMLSNPRRRILMKLRRLSARRKPRSRLERLVAEGDTSRDDEPSRNDIELAVPTPEEAPRVLNSLIAATQRSIEESRRLIAKVNEILTKRERVRRSRREDA
jgi:hypothetical protein